MGAGPQKFGEWFAIILMLWVLLMIIIVGTFFIVRWMVGF